MKFLGKQLLNIFCKKKVARIVDDCIDSSEINCFVCGQIYTCALHKFFFSYRFLCVGMPERSCCKRSQAASELDFGRVDISAGSCDVLCACFIDYREGNYAAM